MMGVRRSEGNWRNQPEIEGLSWMRTDTQLQYRYVDTQLPMFLLILAFFLAFLMLLAPLIGGNPGWVNLKCVRQSPQTGVCQLDKIHLHPFLLPFSQWKEAPLSLIESPEVHQLAGKGNPEQLRLRLKAEQWEILLSRGHLGTGAQEGAQALTDFLRSPTQKQVEVQHFDSFFFWCFYLPLYGLLAYCGLAYLGQKWGWPLNSYCLTLDGFSQSMKIRHSVWVVPLTKHWALKDVMRFSFFDTIMEQRPYFRLQIVLSSAKRVHLMPLLNASKSTSFQEVQMVLLNELNQALSDLKKKG